MTSPPRVRADLQACDGNTTVLPPHNVLSNQGMFGFWQGVHLVCPFGGQFHTLLLKSAKSKVRRKEVAQLAFILENLLFAIPSLAIDGTHGIPAGLPYLPLISVTSKDASTEANQHYDLRRNSSTHSDEYPRHSHSWGRQWDPGSSPDPCGSECTPRPPPRCGWHRTPQHASSTPGAPRRQPTGHCEPTGGTMSA